MSVRHRAPSGGVRISGQLRHLRKRNKNLCHVCGLKVKAEDASRSHIVARSKGGKSSRDNLALAHKWCNSRLGAAIVTDTRVTSAGWRRVK